MRLNQGKRNETAPGSPGLKVLSTLKLSRPIKLGRKIELLRLSLGFLLRSMGKTNALFSVDIDPHTTDFTQKWIERAGLQSQIRLHLSDSASPELPQISEKYFGRPTQLVFIDSSHQYRHTLAELDLWYEALKPGGLILMHDVSIFAQSFDQTGEGGVKRAVDEWTQTHGVQPIFLNAHVEAGTDPNELIYRDGCGLGIIQKSNAD